MSREEAELYLRDFELKFDSLQETVREEEKRQEEINRIKSIPVFRMLVIED